MSLTASTEKAVKPLQLYMFLKAKKSSFPFFSYRKSWGVMTLTSRTGLWISAGLKSAIRKSLCYFCGNSCVQYSHLSLVISFEALAFKAFFVVLWIIDPLNIKICIKLQTLKYCNRKLSKAGVSLLKPEHRIRGAADGFLNSVRTLPCHIIR